MTATYEYMLSFLLEPLGVGEEFTAWPLHVTLVPAWFTTDSDETELIKAVRQVTGGFAPFAVHATRRSRFGWHGTIGVTEIDSQGLRGLHGRLLKLLRKSPYKLRHTKQMGRDFKPHVTKRGRDEVAPGHSFVIDKVYIVRAPVADPRKRLKTIIGIVELADVG